MNKKFQTNNLKSSIKENFLLHLNLNIQLYHMITQMYDANRKLSKELKYFKILSIMISKKKK